MKCSMMKKFSSSVVLVLIALALSACGTNVATENDDPWMGAEHYRYKTVCEGKEDRFIAVKGNMKYGVVDSDNNVIVPFKYDEIYERTEDDIYAVAIDKLSNKHELLNWGFVSEDGMVDIEPSYRKAQMFIGKYAAVKGDSADWFIIDRNGNCISNEELSDSEIKSHEREGYFTFYKDGLAGLYEANTNSIIIPANQYIDINYTGKDDIFEIVIMGPDDIINNMEDKYAGLYSVTSNSIILAPDKYGHLYFRNVGWFAEVDVLGGVSTQKVTWRLNDDFTEWFIVEN